MEAMEDKAEKEDASLQPQQQLAGGSRAELYKSVFIADLGGAAMGFVLGWSSPTLALLQAKDSVFPITEAEGAWITSLLPLGMFLGPFIGQRLLDSVGRRRTILCNMLLALASWALMAKLLSVWLLCLARFIQGITMGLMISSSPVYITEISENSLRGVLNTTLTVLMNSTILLAFAVGPHLSFHHYIYLACSPLLLFFCMYPSLCESPYFLLTRNRDQEAFKVLAKLRQLPETSVAKEIESIKLAITTSKKGSYRELLSKKSNRRALSITCILMLCQQFSGTSCMFYYAQKVFAVSGVAIQSHLGALIMAVFIFVAGLVTPVAVKLWGIKKLLITSAIGSFLNNTLLGYFIQRSQSSQHSSVDNWATIVFFAAYSVISYCGLTPLPWAMIGELFSGHLRARGSALVTLTHALVSFTLVAYFPRLVASVGLAESCWLFSSITLLSTVYISLCVPDTTGLTNTQVQQILRGIKD